MGCSHQWSVYAASLVRLIIIKLQFVKTKKLLKMRIFLSILLLSSFLFVSCVKKASSGSIQSNIHLTKRRAEVLFLGNKGKHHDSGRYAPWLAISLFKEGINLTYTVDLNDLNRENLSHYDGLIIYANHDSLSISQENAMKEFVESGKGLIPLHSASGCFKNSDWYIKTIGGQFKSHGQGAFSTTIINKNHPVTKGISEFVTSWDETYIHQNLNPDMKVLMTRQEGARQEPYTWVRNEGKGRVFYTAYGHSDSTWKNPGFQKLVNSGVLWAIGKNVQKEISNLQIPNVDIYESSGIAISDYTKRHLVPKMQDALQPSESMKMIQVPVDFEVKLFAAEPDIVNPIAMSWDEKGRLWIVESVDYPNTFLETDGAANDRIKICEDTDGDGKADKFTVFADKLNIPTSMVFANGGIIVSMAPHFVFLKDTDGDDKADIRENIMTGWDKLDTHFGPSNLQYGFNNKIWGVVGSGFNGKTKDGKSLSFRTGVYNINPDGTNFDFLGNTSNNTWGLGLTEDNNVFISTANNTHSAFYSMPGKVMQRSLPGSSLLSVQKIDGHYDSHSLTPNLRQVDVVGGFTSAAGHHFYTARSFPKSYWNSVAFICEPTVRIIHNAVIEPKGAGFSEKDGWNFLASSDEWVGPVQAEVGPDGALWVADWYNFIIQHNVFVERQAPSLNVLPFKEQPRGQGNAFISPLRDINFGRIYRVVYKKSKPYQPISLTSNDNSGLINALKSDNMFWRMTAQRLIVESKNQVVIPDLYKIITDKKVDEIGLNSPAVHAIWTLHGLNALSGLNTDALEIVYAALKHPAPGVRKAAIETLPKSNLTLEYFQKIDILNDLNSNVRMSAMLAIAEMPYSESAGAALYKAALKPNNENDEWINQALFVSSSAHREGFLKEASNYPPTNSDSENKLCNKIVTGIKNEIYVLQRRTSFPISPNVENKEIVIKGKITKDRRDLEGFIVGQGGNEEGFGLYIKNNKLIIELKQDGKIYAVATKDPLPEQFNFECKILQQGLVRLEIDGKNSAEGKIPFLFKKPLVQAVRYLRDIDNENSISSYSTAYSSPFDFVGTIQNATFEVRNPVIDGSKPQVVKTTSENITVINLKVIPEQMKYDLKEINVKAGLPVVLTLENPDNMQHNLVICKKGTKEKVGKAADLMAQDPKSVEKNYVPVMSEILAATKLVNPGETATIEFIAPTIPGDYPYICTFPGHWSIMQGIMHVK